MKRRDFIKGAAMGTAAWAMGGEGRAGRQPAPDYLPILNRKMAAGNYVSHYLEPELTEPVLLCDEHGRLNPRAVGWSRFPLVRANLSGQWPRKKKWNFWNWISPDFVFSVTVADIDFACFCAASFTDFTTRKTISTMALKRNGAVPMPEEVERSIAFSSGALDYSMQNEGGDIQVAFRSARMGGREVTADFVIHKPRGHETLNIVVPWSAERFQMNSKHNTLPVEGAVTVAGRRYLMDPERCHGVQDFGRGRWPYRSYWNWGVVTGRQGQDLIGVNLGAKWTTGTGSNENGICYNGRLYKVMEDLVWDYDRGDWMKPWKIRTGYSDMVDLTLTPILANTTNLNLGLLRTGGTCSFGKWNGTLKFDGQTVAVRDLIGWAEEFSHRW
jgi:hypothetical protein